MSYENLSKQFFYLKGRIEEVEEELEKLRLKEVELYKDPELYPGDIVVGLDHSPMNQYNYPEPGEGWFYVPTQALDSQPFLDLCDPGGGRMWRRRNQLPEKIRVFRREAGPAREAVNTDGTAL